MLKFIREKELANMLSVSPAKLSRDRFEQRGLPFYRLERTIIYNLEDVLKSLEDRRIIRK